jgi:hypothetical protein
VDLWLSYVPLEQLRASQLDYDNEAPPRYWTLDGISSGTFQVRLWPAADAVYEVLVYASSIPLPSPMIPLVQTGVRQLFYEHTHEDNAAAREQLKFREQMMDARGRYLQNRALRLQFGYSDVPNYDDHMGRPIMPTNIPVTPIV